MSKDQWARVDAYLCDRMLAPDPILEHALKTSAEARLPAINVAPNQGKLLQLLVRIHGAKNILEIGTLGGYSTLWMATALPADGRVVTLEFDPKHADVARQNFAFAGLSEKIDLRLGIALETLPTLVDRAPFDFIFIDADKVNTADYFQWALRLSRKGTVIIVDNVVRDGAVVDPNNADINVQGVRRFNDLVSHEPRVSATAIQTVGSKGYDGFCIMLVVGHAHR